MKRLPKAYSREKRKAQVLMQFGVWRDNGDTEPKTMYRIARALAMTPQKRITDMLLELVMEGKLTVEERDQSGRYITRFYALAHGADIITRNVLRRKITVSKRGVAVGQLELSL